MALLVLAAMLLGAGSGCDRSPPNEPLVESFSFPVSIVGKRYDVGGDLFDALFVVNANFDLQLRGGSVVVVDMGAAEAAAPACANATSDSGDCLRATIGGPPRLRPASFIHALDSVRIASYAREIIADADGRNLYVTSGGDDSVTWIEVDPERLRSDRAGGVGVLSCFSAGSEEMARLSANANLVDASGDVRDEDGDGVEDEQLELLDCGDPWTPRRGLFDSEVADAERADAAAAAGVTEEEWRRYEFMLSSPFGLALNGAGTLLHVANFDSAGLGVLRVKGAGDSCVGVMGMGSCVGQPVFLNAFPSVTLATGVAVHPATDLVYVTGRSPAGSTSGVRIDVFETAAMATEPEPFLPILDPEVTVSGTEEEQEVSPLLESFRLFREAGHDLRGIRFSTDGSRAYVAERSGGADSLLILDVTGAAAGEIEAPFETAIDVGRGAQNLVVIPGAGAAGGDVVVVSCFADSALYVVDTDLLEVVQIIRTDTGPFGLALLPDALAPERLLVASFSASTVTAIDITADARTWEPAFIIGAQRIEE